MKNTVLKFGIISGLISSALMFATLPFMHTMSMTTGMVIGYAGMILAFLLVFFGIRSYRDKVNNGSITFRKALGLGLLIALITCLFYVFTWEIVYANFMPDFMDKYAAYTIEQMKSAHASDAEIHAAAAELQANAENYKNPLFRMLYTFMEPLPVALIMTLVSALVLKRKKVATA